MTAETSNYQTMLTELENIMREVNQPDIDLDLLVNKVERGYDLILSMRDRLQQTKAKVAELHKKFEDTLSFDAVPKN